MKIGDLVRRIHYSDDGYKRDKELFIVLDIIGDHHGRRDKTHEMILKVWEVTELLDQVSHVPMNIFEVVC